MASMSKSVVKDAKKAANHMQILDIQKVLKPFGITYFQPFH